MCRSYEPERFDDDRWDKALGGGFGNGEEIPLPEVPAIAFSVSRRGISYRLANLQKNPSVLGEANSRHDLWETGKAFDCLP
jgi:hypothetical protein